MHRSLNKYEIIIIINANIVFYKNVKNYKNYLDKQQPKDQRIIDGIYHFEHLENKLIIFLC